MSLLDSAAIAAPAAVAATYSTVRGPVFDPDSRAIYSVSQRSTDGALFVAVQRTDAEGNPLKFPADHADKDKRGQDKPPRKHAVRPIARAMLLTVDGKPLLD